MASVISDYRKVEKTRAFCWIISNCETMYTPRFERAAKIIDELPEKVHIWGKGGVCLKKHPRKTHIIKHGPFEFGDENWQENIRKIRTCKFYFAFENSNCTNYVTEKFGNALQAFAVPIVNGYRSSYDKILPGSFIYPPDFRNEVELAR